MTQLHHMEARSILDPRGHIHVVLLTNTTWKSLEALMHYDFNAEEFLYLCLKADVTGDLDSFVYSALYYLQEKISSDYDPIPSDWSKEAVISARNYFLKSMKPSPIAKTRLEVPLQIFEDGTPYHLKLDGIDYDNYNYKTELKTKLNLFKDDKK